MSHPAALPTWVIDLVIALEEYRDTHPTTYAQYAGSDTWQKADCACTVLNHVPSDVWTYAAGYRAGLQQADK